jgi:mannosyltransferase
MTMGVSDQTRARSPRTALRPLLSDTRARVGILMLVAAALRFTAIGHQSFWFDEAGTVRLAHFPLIKMLAAVRTTDTNPPLYYALVWCWARVFGFGEAGVRSLSALAGTMTVPVVFAAGREFVSKRVGLTAAAIAACSPALIWYSQEARSYSVLLLLTSVALLALAHLRTAPSGRWAGVWAVSAALSLWTHYYAAIVVIPEFIWLAVRYRHDRTVRMKLIVFASAALLLLPVFVEQAATLSGINWFQLIPLGTRAAQVPAVFALGPATVAPGPLSALAVAVLLVSAWLLISRGRPLERRSVRVLSSLLGAALAIVVMLIASGHDSLDFRNLLVLWLPCALIVAIGLGSERAGILGTAATAVLCAVGLTAATAVRVDWRLQRPDWRAVAGVLAKDPRAASFMVDGCPLTTLQPHLDRIQAVPSGGVMVRTIDVITAPPERTWDEVFIKDWFTVCERVPRPIRLPAQLGAFSRLGHPVRVNQFLITRYRSSNLHRLSLATFAAGGLQGTLLSQFGGSPVRTAAAHRQLARAGG